MTPVSPASPSDVAAEELPQPDTSDDRVESIANRQDDRPVNLGIAVASYIVQWLIYWLVALGALAAGPPLGTAFTGLVTGEHSNSSTTQLETYHLLALAPDQAFASLAVLVVFVLTLSAGFSDRAVRVDPDVAYVRYRVQTWLLALAGICCNAIALMLGLYAAVNWGSSDSKFQTALLPVAIVTAVAASLLSVGRERQMQLEAVMLGRGIRKLERQHQKATKKWDRHWGPDAYSAEKVTIRTQPFLRVCCYLTAAQFLVLLVQSLLDNRGVLGAFAALVGAILEVSIFCVLPYLAVMTTVANILRRQEMSERLFKMALALAALLLIGVYTPLVLAAGDPRQNLPHLVLPIVSSLTLLIPLLLPLFRCKLTSRRNWKNYAWFASQDLQRTLEQRIERRRRRAVDARIFALQVELQRRINAYESVR